MFKEENLFFPDKNNVDNEKMLEIKNFPLIYPLESESFFSNKINLLNNGNSEELSIEEMIKIMNGPKFVLEEDVSENIYFAKKNKVELQITETSTKMQSIIEKKEDSLFKNINFKTYLSQKRGRKPKEGINKKKQKCHSSVDFDNIQRKIQVSFISFLVRLANDALKSVFGQNTKFNFKHVDYELKKIVNHNYIEFLKKSKYSDIMKMKISPKNKKFEKDSNKKTLQEVCKYSDKLKHIFEKKYLYIFKKYYCNLINDKNEVDIEGIKITLSPKTKALSSLLESNKANKEKFENVVKDVYLSDFNDNIEKKFIISSSSFPSVIQENNKNETIN